MSQEAAAYVRKHTAANGVGLMVLNALAIRCRKRKGQLLVSATAVEIAADARLSPRHVQRTLEKLVAEKELELICRGVGRSPNLYQIRCRSYDNHVVTRDGAKPKLPEGSYDISLYSSEIDEEFGSDMVREKVVELIPDPNALLSRAADRSRKRRIKLL